MKLLEVNDLSLSFDQGSAKSRVLHNISFSLYKSRTLGIVGESGSGKSLTALSVIKLLPENAIIESGEIIYNDENSPLSILQLNQESLLKVRGKEITMIFQEPMTSLNPSLTCGYQVAEVLLNHTKTGKKDSWNKVLELFREVQLPDPSRIYHSYPHEISGGQKQRVMIAMAIALKPKILIADEPTTALDVTVQKAILELLKDIQRKYHMSIIFISHDLGVISQIADHILVMYQGKVVEYGTNEAVLKNAKHPYTKGLLNCRPEINFTKNRLPVLSDFLDKNKDEKSGKHLEQTKKASDNNAEEILKVEELSKVFGSKAGFLRKADKEQVAVNKMSFSVFKGETLGLVGESGCGKTTLGRLLVQLIHQNSGTIIYRRKRINNLSTNELKAFRKNVQIVFQDPYSSLNPKLTVGEALQEPLKVHGLGKSKSARKQQAIDMLEKVKLGQEAYSKYPHQFSGGQRQRIVIARALILKPEFIICDESVSALDVSVQAEILNLLNDLKREFKLTYIFISHDLSVVKYMSDRIMVMRAGELVEINKADELYQSPASDYTKKLIESIPSLTTS